MAYSRIRFEIQNSATMTLVHSQMRLRKSEAGFSTAAQWLHFAENVITQTFFASRGFDVKGDAGARA